MTHALTEEPGLRSVELLHRARQAGYAGGKSALYALAQTLRSTTVRPQVRFDGLPGEFSQHDFGEVDVRYQDGTEARVHFFASRLKYSRWVEVTLVADERVEALVRALVDHLAAFGGVPLVGVFDRPKTVALQWGRDGVVTEWNPTFAGVALDLGLGVEVTVAPRTEAVASDALALRDTSGRQAAISYWSFEQLAGIAAAPPKYLRTLPAEIASHAINYGLRRQRREQHQLLVDRDEAWTIDAVTPPRYARVHHDELAGEVLDRVLSVSLRDRGCRRDVEAAIRAAGREGAGCCGPPTG